MLMRGSLAENFAGNELSRIFPIREGGVRFEYPPGAPDSPDFLERGSVT